MDEILDYTCGHCGGTTWRVFVATNRDDDTAYLLLRCSDEECYQKQRAEQETKPGDLVLSGVFDISGQGPDIPDNPSGSDGGMVN